MNQKMFKKFLVAMLAFNIFTTTAFSMQVNGSKTTYAQEKQDFAFVITDQKGPIMTKDFTFEVINEKGEISKVKSMMSMLNLKLSNGKYTVRLKDDEYTMKDVSFTVTDDGIANYDSIVNFMLRKKKSEGKAKEIPVTLMLTTQKGEAKDVVMRNYEFEVFDKETGKFVTSATSDKSMLNLKLLDGIYTLKLKKNKDYTMKDIRLDVYEDDGSYTIDEKESMELNLVKIQSEDEKPAIPEIKGSKEVLVRVLFDGKPKVDFKVGLMEFNPIPNIIQQGSTNEKGEVKFSGFKSNVKYQLRLRSTDKTMTFETEVFEFTTNEKGLITKINDKEVSSKEDAVVEFRGSNKDSEKFKTFPVEFYAKYKDGTPAKGVEFSINRLSPRLSSYRKVKSDENGKVVFMLEGEAPKDASFGRLYNITISKMEMFKHKSVPFGMDFTVDDKGNIKVISVEREIDDKETDTSNPDKYNKTFTLEKVDKTQIYKDFKFVYDKAVEYLKNTKFENSKEADKAKKDLENIIDASKIELEETIPEYALKKIEELNTAIDNLKKYEYKSEKVKDSWKLINNEWFRYDKDGNIMKNSWFEENGNWYYLESNGSMSNSKWVLASGNWYYANAGGRISQNEWVLVDGEWYYANASGRIVSNEWFIVDKKWYYAEDDGHIAQGKILKIKNINYTFDSNGALVK
ncbi:hypothetical protein WFJ11_01255 [Parvimonas micra]|uniref:N-acetylmuramoyl-L-alanine amidase family protein n=1 Tax=Parvimonas micra TaxID=33033 RepID=UPI0030D16D52